MSCRYIIEATDIRLDGTRQSKEYTEVQSQTLVVVIKMMGVVTVVVMMLLMMVMVVMIPLVCPFVKAFHISGGDEGGSAAGLKHRS